MGNESLDKTSLQTAALYTTGIQLLPVNIPDLTLLIGTGLHITRIPAHSQVREVQVYDLVLMPIVSSESKAHSEITSQTDYTPTPRSRYSMVGPSNIIGEFILKDSNNAMSTADLIMLLLMCGDIESNPGPADRDVDLPQQNRQMDRVRPEIFIIGKIVDISNFKFTRIYKKMTLSH